MNLKLFSYLLIVLVCCASLIAAHGHSHDGDHHHSHGEDVKPSFKYSRQANEEVKHESHHHHDDDHIHNEHHGHHHEANSKAKEPSAG